MKDEVEKNNYKKDKKKHESTSLTRDSGHKTMIPP